MVSFYVQVFFVLYIIYVNIYRLFKESNVLKNIYLISGKVKEKRGEANFTYFFLLRSDS